MAGCGEAIAGGDIEDNGGQGQQGRGGGDKDQPGSEGQRLKATPPWGVSGISRINKRA